MTYKESQMGKASVWLRLVLIAVILFSISSVVYFLLSSTAYLQRGMDLIGTTYLVSVCIPILIGTLILTGLLINGWSPTNGKGYVKFFLGIVLIILFAATLIGSVNSNGWTKQKMESDTLKMTADGAYEYRIDLINLFQRNSRARLYLKNVDSGEESYIPVNIKTRKLVSIGVGKVNHWVKLEPTNNSLEYILYTTQELRLPEERFKIDIPSGTSSPLD